MLTRKRIIRVILAGLLCMPLAALPAQKGQREKPRMERNVTERACQDIGKGQAIAIASARVGGKALSANAQRRGNQIIYRVKMMSNGRIRTVLVDGCNGRVLGIN